MGELIDKVKGKAKRVQGAVTGNRAKEAEGALDEAKGSMKGAFDEAKVEVKRAIARARTNRRPAGSPSPR